MNRSKIKRWLWLLVALAWGIVYGLLTLDQREPLTGLMPTTHFALAGIQGLLAGLATYCAVSLRWRVVASILVFLALFFAFPLPSMAGLRIRIENRTDTDAVIAITRTDSADRCLNLSLSAGTNFAYRTAPGDWGSSAGLSFRKGSNEITATFLEIRQQKVVVTSEGLKFEVVSPTPTGQSTTNSVSK